MNKEQFFQGIESRKTKEEDENHYWDYVYKLIKDYTPEKVHDFLQRRISGTVTEKEIEVHKAYCAFNLINY